MAKRADNSLLESFVQRMIRRSWAQRAREVKSTKLKQLRKHRNRAGRLRSHLDDLIHTADGRIHRARMTTDLSTWPEDADWSWRPLLWITQLAQPGYAAPENRTRLGYDLTLFHDCPLAEMNLRQVPNPGGHELPPFGARLEVFGFAGSFLSLAVDLPQEALDGLNLSHIIQAEMRLDIESPVKIFARLNIKNGPNVAELINEMHVGTDKTVTEFDLAYSKMNDKRIERAWIDILFDNPEMNQILIREFRLHRMLRADL